MPLSTPNSAPQQCCCLPATTRHSIQHLVLVSLLNATISGNSTRHTQRYSLPVTLSSTLFSDVAVSVDTDSNLLQ